jgi:hypothetical protein
MSACNAEGMTALASPSLERVYEVTTRAQRSEIEAELTRLADRVPRSGVRVPSTRVGSQPVTTAESRWV